MSKRTLQGLRERVSRSNVLRGILLSLVGFVTVVGVMLKNQFIASACCAGDGEVPMSTIGQALLGSEKYQYVLPFEFISVFLLACIIGGIMVARKEKEVK